MPFKELILTINHSKNATYKIIVKIKLKMLLKK